MRVLILVSLHNAYNVSLLMYLKDLDGNKMETNYITALHSLDHYIFQFFSLVSQVLYESNSFVFERKQNLFFQFLNFVVLLMYF